MGRRRDWPLLVLFLPTVVAYYENPQRGYDANPIGVPVPVDPAPYLPPRAPIARGYQPPPQPALFEPPRSYYVQQHYQGHGHGHMPSISNLPPRPSTNWARPQRPLDEAAERQLLYEAERRLMTMRTPKSKFNEDEFLMRAVGAQNGAPPPSQPGLPLRQPEPPHRLVYTPKFNPAGPPAASPPRPASSFSPNFIHQRPVAPPPPEEIEVEPASIDLSSLEKNPPDIENNIIVHIFLNSKEKKPAHAVTKIGPIHGVFGIGTAHGGPGTHQNPIVIVKDFDRDKLKFVDEQTALQMMEEGPANIVEVKAMVSTPDKKIEDTLNRAVNTELDRAIPKVLTRFHGTMTMDTDLRKELEQALVDEIAKNLGETIDTMSGDITEDDLEKLIEEGFESANGLSTAAPTTRKISVVTMTSTTEAPTTQTSPTTKRIVVTVGTRKPVMMTTRRTQAPSTEAPPTEAPPTEAPPTEAPETEAPETEVPPATSRRPVTVRPSMRTRPPTTQRRTQAPPTTEIPEEPSTEEPRSEPETTSTSRGTEAPPTLRPMSKKTKPPPTFRPMVEETEPTTAPETTDKWTEAPPTFRPISEEETEGTTTRSRPQTRPTTIKNVVPPSEQWTEAPPTLRPMSKKTKAPHTFRPMVEEPELTPTPEIPPTETRTEAPSTFSEEETEATTRRPRPQTRPTTIRNEGPPSEQWTEAPPTFRPFSKKTKAPHTFRPMVEEPEPTPAPETPPTETLTEAPPTFRSSSEEVTEATTRRPRPHTRPTTIRNEGPPSEQWTEAPPTFRPMSKKTKAPPTFRPMAEEIEPTTAPEATERWTEGPPTFRPILEETAPSPKPTKRPISHTPPTPRWTEAPPTFRPIFEETEEPQGETEIPTRQTPPTQRRTEAPPTFRPIFEETRETAPPAHQTPPTPRFTEAPPTFRPVFMETEPTPRATQTPPTRKTTQTPYTSPQGPTVQPEKPETPIHIPDMPPAWWIPSSHEALPTEPKPISREETSQSHELPSEEELPQTTKAATTSRTPPPRTFRIKTTPTPTTVRQTPSWVTEAPTTTGYRELPPETKVSIDFHHEVEATTHRNIANLPTVHPSVPETSGEDFNIVTSQPVHVVHLSSHEDSGEATPSREATSTQATPPSVPIFNENVFETTPTAETTTHTVTVVATIRPTIVHSMEKIEEEEEEREEEKFRGITKRPHQSFGEANMMKTTKKIETQTEEPFEKSGELFDTQTTRTGASRESGETHTTPALPHDGGEPPKKQITWGQHRESFEIPETQTTKRIKTAEHPETQITPGQHRESAKFPETQTTRTEESRENGVTPTTQAPHHNGGEAPETQTTRGHHRESFEIPETQTTKRIKTVEHPETQITPGQHRESAEFPETQTTRTEESRENGVTQTTQAPHHNGGEAPETQTTRGQHRESFEIPETQTTKRIKTVEHPVTKIIPGQHRESAEFPETQTTRTEESRDSGETQTTPAPHHNGGEAPETQTTRGQHRESFEIPETQTTKRIKTAEHPVTKITPGQHRESAEFPETQTTKTVESIEREETDATVQPFEKSGELFEAPTTRRGEIGEHGEIQTTRRGEDREQGETHPTGRPRVFTGAPELQTTIQHRQNTQRPETQTTFQAENEGRQETQTTPVWREVTATTETQTPEPFVTHDLSAESTPPTFTPTWQTVPSSHEIDEIVPKGACPTPSDPSDGRKADVLFLLDSSNKFTEDKFMHAITLILDTVERLKNIGPDGVQVSLVQFNTEPYLEFSLRKHDCKQFLKDDIADTQYMTGGRMLGRALEKVTKFAFTRKRGDRTDAENILVILTDGQEEDKVQLPVKVSKDEDVTVFVIGTLEANPEYLRNLAGSQDNVFRLNGTANHRPLAEQLAGKIAKTSDSREKSGEEGESVDVVQHRKPVDMNDISSEESTPSLISHQQHTGVVHLECTSEGFKMKLNLPGQFVGHMVVKGHEHDQNCQMAIRPTESPENRTLDYFVAADSCGVTKIASEHPKGQNSSVIVQLVHAPQLRTEEDRAFLLQCFVGVPDHDEEVSTHLDVVKSEVTVAETISLSSLPPTCNYSIRKDRPDGPVATKASVGQAVYHRWDCDGGEKANNVYGIKVHSCFASYDVKQKNAIVDINGCSADKALLTNLVYDEDRLSAYALSHVFGATESESLKFSCKLSLCTRDGDGCEGVTPPMCGNNHTDLLVWKKVEAPDEALTSALSTAVDIGKETQFSKVVSAVVDTKIFLALAAAILFVAILTITVRRVNQRQPSSPSVSSRASSQFEGSASSSVESQTSGPAPNPRLAEFLKTFDRSRYV